MGKRKRKVPTGSKEDYPYYIDNYFSILREDTLLEIEILKALAEIKIEEEFKLANLETIDDYKL